MLDLQPFTPQWTPAGDISPSQWYAKPEEKKFSKLCNLSPEFRKSYRAQIPLEIIWSLKCLDRNVSPGIEVTLKLPASLDRQALGIYIRQDLCQITCIASQGYL